MSPYSRRQAIVTAAGFTAFATLGAKAQNSNVQRSAIMDIDIKRNGSRPSTKGSPDWFTGSVRVDPLFQAPDPGRVSGGQVTFEPGARTAWHTHPDKRWSSWPVSDGCSVRAVPSKRSVRATWFGFGHA